LHVLRPADARETAAAWLHALQRRCGPSALVLSRQNLPQLAGTGKEALRGGYIIGHEKGSESDLILIASGSELQLALEAQEHLQKEGLSVRVVSIVSIELFMAQDHNYREAVLPSAVKKRIIIEAAHPMAWGKIGGPDGIVIGIDDFGASAPGNIVMVKRGITVDAILEKANQLKAGRQ